MSITISYRGKYKRFKKASLALNLTSVGPTSLGTILVLITFLFPQTISGVGVLIESYLTKSSTHKKVEACSFVYRSYKKILTKTRSFLRGQEYDNEMFLSEVRIIDVWWPPRVPLLMNQERFT